ncbi:MAG: exodeoxyribonuclease VII small subunit [Candidatus Neomarinimicrobiota bacterium]|nr:exodeoxyribonuclease VII small subunit [Candidatus Neomarinimicrobiota bacterium]|tara:strand:- start:86 stop:313 length:228 start_codon:yes stop_codon:yes gene_type:complete
MTAKKTFNFESAMIELEKIVKRLEGENESLEKSLELFEKGTKLAEQLRGKLDAAEQRIKVLQKDKEVEINREDIS